MNYYRLLMDPSIKNRVQLAVELGMDLRTMTSHEAHPDWVLCRELIEKWQESRARERTFGDYVFKNLSSEARKLWEELQFWAEHKDRQEHVDRILRGRAVKIKQELFIHALVCTHYDISRACTMTGLTRATLDHWRVNDLEFAQLVEEIQWHKKNFFEKAMLDLVRDRNPLATIWVNKTVNADRGYSEKIRVEHTGVVNGGFNFEDLDLDLDTRRKIVEAIRKKQLAQETASTTRSLPAPPLEVEAEEVP